MDSGKHLFVEVTPVALTGITSGTPVPSPASAQIVTNHPPTATGVSVSGTPLPGAQLTGSYTYNDAEGDPEGASVFRWFRSNDGTLGGGDTLVGTASSYEVQAGDAGKTLFFQVTPRAATGSPTGSAAASAGVWVVGPPPGLNRKSILIEENFGGAGGPLHGTQADYFDTAITVAGGSNTWAAGVAFLDNGKVNVNA
ncbi:MAG: hypothetical protein MUF81_17525, partial [Verrucomicrobia bacterium]|nr:hypothetical protein [Verrucomicrobiota bacterium]